MENVHVPMENLLTTKAIVQLVTFLDLAVPFVLQFLLINVWDALMLAMVLFIILLMVNVFVTITSTNPIKLTVNVVLAMFQDVPLVQASQHLNKPQPVLFVWILEPL